MRFAIKTFGCRTNTAESEWLVSRLLKLGFRVDIENPDLFIVNTCTVTKTASRKIRQFIRSQKRKKPLVTMIVFGCGVRQKNNQYVEMAEVDMYLENDTDVLAYVKDKFAITSPRVDAIALKELFENTLRARAIIKVQEGCNEFCSYCIIPLVRGRERSIPIETIVNKAVQKEQEGFTEIVLTGTHIGHYGVDLEEDLTIAILVERILEATNNIRIRISSIEPEMFDVSLYDIFGIDRVCPHIHLCLQSGSGTVLERMGRRYSTAQFREIVKQLRLLRPDIAITTDVIVGFPGESDEEFEETKQYIEDIGFAKLHVFPFSVRPQTKAQYMDSFVPVITIKERSKELRSLSKAMEDKYAKKFIGQDCEVVFESASKGISGNYLEVTTEKLAQSRECHTVKITKHIDRLRVQGDIESQ